MFICIENLKGRESSALIHAHIKWSIVRVREATLSIIELHR